MAGFGSMLSARTSCPRSDASFTFFLDLPREIRTMIYSYIVHDLVLVIHDPLPETPETAILRCSRLIRQEAIQLVHFRVTRHEFFALIFALPQTVSCLSQLHDLAQIRNLVITSFASDKLVYDASTYALRPYTSLPGLRRAQVELELCSCGPMHYFVRRRSYAEVQCSQKFDTDQHGDDSNAAKTIWRNQDKLGEYIRWMRNVRGYEVETRLVLMDNRGEESST
jgi:hypothetical protein